MVYARGYVCNEMKNQQSLTESFCKTKSLYYTSHSSIHFDDVMYNVSITTHSQFTIKLTGVVG